jgi:hypothetical protein
VRVTTLYIKLWHVQVVLLTVDHRRVVKNGTCGTDSCNKLTVFDWLSMSLPGQAPFDCVKFVSKTEEKFYRNTEKLTLSMGTLWLLSLLWT